MKGGPWTQSMKVVHGPGPCFVLTHFYSLCGIILQLQKEVIGSGLENMFKNHEKEHSGHDENMISFSILFSTLQLFFNPLFFAFLQQFTAGENLKVAGDSAGRWRILTTLSTYYHNNKIFYTTTSQVSA